MESIPKCRVGAEDDGRPVDQISTQSIAITERRSIRRISRPRVDGVLARPLWSLPETSPPGHQLTNFE